ncbi:MAG: TonB family protein [Planctomycetes bacterium]|nr:TonB family protein [Planctomycetota bacterium]
MVFALTLHALAIAIAWGFVQFQSQIGLESSSVISLSKNMQQTLDDDAVEEDSKEQTEPEIETPPMPVQEDFELVEIPIITEPAPEKIFTPSAESLPLDQPKPNAVKFVRAEGLPEPNRTPTTSDLSLPTKPVQKSAPKPTSKKPVSKPKAASKSNSGTEVPPRMLEQNWPRVIEDRFKGSITVVVKVNQYGHATSVNIIKGTGRDGWDRELKRTFLKSAYAPATRNGKPANGSLRFRMKFKGR